MTGKQFREIRELLGFTQTEMAAVLGYAAYIAVAAAERAGENPIPPRTAERLVANWSEIETLIEDAIKARQKNLAKATSRINRITQPS